MVTDRRTDRPTDRPTDIATYRAAIAAKNELVRGKTEGLGSTFISVEGQLELTLDLL